MFVYTPSSIVHLGNEGEGRIETFMERFTTGARIVFVYNREAAYSPGYGSGVRGVHLCTLTKAGYGSCRYSCTRYHETNKKFESRSCLDSGIRPLKYGRPHVSDISHEVNCELRDFVDTSKPTLSVKYYSAGRRSSMLKERD